MHSSTLQTQSFDGNLSNIHHISLRAHLQTHFQSLPPHTDRYVTSHLHTEKGRWRGENRALRQAQHSHRVRHQERRYEGGVQILRALWRFTLFQRRAEVWKMRESRDHRGSQHSHQIHRFFQLAQAFRLVQFYSHRQSLRTFALTRPDTIPLTDLHWSYKEQTQSLHPQKIKKAGG